jgi:DNA polymerase-3 subunit beta
MTTTILQDTLKTALSIVSKAATSKTLPVLASIKLEASEISLALTATDLETAIHITVPASTDKPFSTCAPASVLASLVQASDAPNIQFKPLDGEKLSLLAGGAKSSLHCLPADDFPLPPKESMEMGVIPANVLRSALKRVLIAASNDQSRPALCGVQLALLKEKIYLAAADGFRLAAYRLDHELKFPGKSSLVIPRSSALKLAAILPDSDEPVAISITTNGSALCFAWVGLKFWAQLLDMNFPDWQAIIPASFKHEIYLPAKQTVEAIQRAEVFARNGSHNVSFAPAETGMTVTGQSDETGKSETALDVVMPFRISFNAIFARQGMEAIAADQVHLRLSDPKGPALFTNPDNSGAGGTDRYIYLLMPMITVEDQANAAKAAQAAAEVQA